MLTSKQRNRNIAMFLFHPPGGMNGVQSDVYLSVLWHKTFIIIITYSCVLKKKKKNSTSRTLHKLQLNFRSSFSDLLSTKFVLHIAHGMVYYLQMEIPADSNI